MSKFRVTVIALVLMTGLSSAAPVQARRLFGVVPFGAFGRVFARGHGHHRRVHFRRIESPVASQNNPSTSNPTAHEPSGGDGLAARKLFADPAARRQIAANAALA